MHRLETFASLHGTFLRLIAFVLLSLGVLFNILQLSSGTTNLPIFVTVSDLI
jgi:hypothetical protein